MIGLRPALLASAVVALHCASAAPASAVTVSDYQKWRHATRTVQATPTGLIELRIGGILRGAVLLNRRLDKSGLPVFFCPKSPGPTGGLAARAARMLLDKELKSPSRAAGKPWPPKTLISAVVLHILRREWACPADRKTVP